MEKSEIKKLLKEKWPETSSSQKDTDKQTIYKAAFILSLFAISAFLFLFFESTLFSGQNRPDTPRGAISTPTPMTMTGEKVNVSGKTENLEPGAYPWLAVDKPDLGLCWPKAPRLKANCSFSTVIHEGGPKELYTLSLYIVNKTVNDQWQEWLDSGRLGGLPMPPDKRRLDSVILILGEG